MVTGQCVRRGVLPGLEFIVALFFYRVTPSRQLISAVSVSVRFGSRHNTTGLLTSVKLVPVTFT